MGTEVLRPQDCFIERIRVPTAAVFPRRRSNYYGTCNPNPNYSSNSRSNRKPAVRSERTDQRKRYGPSPSEPTPAVSKRSISADDLRTAKSNTLVMEKVTILRRGESLDSKIKNSESLKKVGDGLVVTSTDRLGPDPEMVPKQIRIVDLKSSITGKCDVYAGSAFFVSPAPSSLPLPSFSKKKQISIDDSATKDLRRLLRLDF